MLYIIDFNKEDYIKTLERQLKIFNEKLKNNEKDDFVLIGSHYNVYTCGKRTKTEHIYSIPSNIPVINIERGGSITFHGEGQIVVYPILDLRNYKFSVKGFSEFMEEIIIKTCKHFGIDVYRKKGYTGVFTDIGKIGFVGFRVSKFITMHGFSLNVCVDKKFFSNINPCGINTEVVSMCDFNKDVNMSIVKDFIKKIISQKFSNYTKVSEIL